MGHHLHLFIGWSQGEEFADHLQSILIPSIRGHYQPELSPEDVERLIEQINQL